MKKVLTVLIAITALLLSMVTGFVLAGESLSLRRAVELALSGNPKARLASVQAERAMVSYESLVDTIDSLTEILNATGTLDDELMEILYVGPAQADQIKNLAERREEMEKNLLAVEAQRNYLNLSKAQDQLALAELGLDRAAEQKRLAEVAYRVGTVARSDVMGAEAQLSLAEVQFFAAESAIQTAQAALNKSMGRSLDEPVAPDADFTLPQVGPVNLKNGLDSAAGRLDVVVAVETLSVKEKQFAYAKHTYHHDSTEYRAAELEADEALLSKQIALENARLEVHQLYHLLAGMEKQQEALEKSVNFAAEAYRLAMLRYEAGIATQMEVTSALQILSERETQLLHARYDHYLNYLNWVVATGRQVE
jgi:outer membrane protein TolC